LGCRSPAIAGRFIGSGSECPLAIRDRETATTVVVVTHIFLVRRGLITKLRRGTGFDLVGATAVIGDLAVPQRIV
jgi:hypothetical protein